ncbi:MAG: adenylate/guanylate cyclase domain-containing protein [Thermoleophilaceae bacterium]
MHTFAFVDIVGFTAYTARRGDAEAARLAVGVGSRIRALLPAHGAEAVKSLGDGMMIRADDPSSALRLAERLRQDADAGRLPRLRIGVECGPAVAHAGDWYGATVNRAARLCAAARPGEVLVGAGVRAAMDGRGPALRRRLTVARGLPLRARVYATLPEPPAPAPLRGLLCRLRVLSCPRHTLERAA